MPEIKSILPPNATPLLRDFESATGSRLAILSDNQLRWLNNPDLCPVHILPWLAWAVSVDVWNDDWSDEQKRMTIRQAIQIHRQTGTLGALRRALSAFTYANIDIKEWFETGGDPFTFSAVIEFIADGASVGYIQDIYETIMRTKNLRSWLKSITAQIETKNALPNIACAFAFNETITVYPK